MPANLEKSGQVRSLAKFNKYLLFLVLYVLIYFIICLVFYTQVEKWNFSEAFYFVVVLVTTVGFGDFVPTTDGSKIFTIFAAVFGLGLFSLFLGVRIRGLGDDELEDRMERMKKMTGKKSDASDSKNSVRRRLLKNLLWSSLASVLWAAIAIVFSTQHQKYRFVDAFYMAVMAGTSIGFGDFSPSETRNGSQDYGGMWFYIIYILVAFGLVLNVVGLLSRWLSMQDVMLDLSFFSYQVKSESVSKEVLSAFDRDGDGKVTRDEWLATMLVLNNICSIDVIDSIFERFDEVKNADGHLSLKDAQKQIPEDQIHLSNKNVEEVKRRNTLNEDISISRQTSFGFQNNNNSHPLGPTNES